jgi:REP element-mobilizing transposase RayT
VRLLRRREQLTEPDFALLAQAFNRARALHPFYLTAWVFLHHPSADAHCIGAPVYPVTISLAMKSVKQSSMRVVNQRRGADGELWQPSFFDRALRSVKEYSRCSADGLARREAGRVKERCPGRRPLAGLDPSTIGRF